MGLRKLSMALLAIALVGMVAITASPVSASSHREAPLISGDPVADNTDLYAFRDPRDPTKINIYANYIGLETPAAGPNFYRFGDDVLYEIKIDNNGDVAEDITYQFRFRTLLQNPNTFLYNTGPIDPATSANQNLRQVYSVRRIEGGVSTVVADNVRVPPDNVGPRSTPDYTDYDDATIGSLPGGGKVFAGQRDEPFFADLGSIFDLGALRPIQSNHLINRPRSRGGVDGLRGYSVHTIALQLPISEVSNNGNVPTTVDSKDSVIGIYAASSRQQTRVLSATGGPPVNQGQYVQVSRLGVPLVNEVLIPLGQKDRWNAIDPVDDAQFFDEILDPELTRLLPTLYPGVFNAGNVPAGGQANRPDLVQLLTGQLSGLSAANALPPADLLRLNLAVPPVAGTTANRLGALQGDTGGFPNGRRLTDDVVDIEIRVLAGELLDDDGTIDGTQVPYSALSDGVDRNNRSLQSRWPYLTTPISGYDYEPGGD